MGGNHKGEPVASVAPVVPVVPKDKADNGAGDRFESAGNETAPDPQDNDAQPLTGVAGTTEDAEPDTRRATTSAEGTSGVVNSADATAERAGDADDTAKAADVDGEEEPAASKKRPKPIQLPDLYRPELKPPEAIS